MSEAMSLTVGGVLFDDKGGARLFLPDEDAGPSEDGAPDDLRGRWRPVPARLARTTLHTDRPFGPRFVTMGNPFREITGRPFAPKSVYSLLKNLSRFAELRRITPHDFQHTRATQAARSGWNESQPCAYFGSKPGNKTPSHYIHLAAQDNANLVRRNVGISEDGQRLSTGAIDDAALDRILKRKLKKLLLEKLSGVLPVETAAKVHAEKVSLPSGNKW